MCCIRKGFNDVFVYLPQTTVAIKSPNQGSYIIKQVYVQLFLNFARFQDTEISSYFQSTNISCEMDFIIMYIIIIIYIKKWKCYCYYSLLTYFYKKAVLFSGRSS